MARHLENKIVVVTGAARGIGLSIADNFLQNEAKVVIILDVDEEEGAKAANALNNKYGGGRAAFIKCDVTKDLQKVSSEVISAYKTIDVLVNSAGWVREESLKETMDLNVIALIEWSEKIFEHMRTDAGGKGGTILNISSIYGYTCGYSAPYYTASKHAVMGFTKTKGHAKNFAKTGVRMVVICPGFTRTDLFKGLVNDESLEIMEQAVWQGPDAVGEAAVEIFKQADSGTAWVIDGGEPTKQVS